ncbi:MAG: hypothetical protein HC773_01400 [Scytonema sp. CRU_2_7]|nr:hypothetical protein [Scytonema sp. CRU_2_7]
MIQVYLASGWFSPTQREEVDVIESWCDNHKDITLYSPRRESNCPPTADESTQKKVFSANIVNIVKASLVIVNTRDKDLGTIFEAGVAFSRKIPIIYFAQGLTGTFNLMLSQSGIAVSTTYHELAKHVNGFIQNPRYTSPYTGVIE